MMQDFIKIIKIKNYNIITWKMSLNLNKTKD